MTHKRVNKQEALNTAIKAAEAAAAADLECRDHREDPDDVDLDDVDLDAAERWAVYAALEALKHL